MMKRFAGVFYAILFSFAYASILEAAPTITSVNPSFGTSIGGFVYLNGSGFCESQCSSASSTETTVSIGGVTVAPNWIQDGFLWFYVPDGAVSAPVVVNTPNGSVVSSQTLLVLGSSMPVFQDMAGLPGFDFSREGSALAWIDFDNDGWQDLYIEGKLFKNNQGTSFSLITNSGLEAGGIPAVADIDNDGLDDILLVRVGVNSLYRNIGSGAFEDVTTQTGLSNETGNSQGAAFGDVDGDGDLDLYVGNFSGTSPNHLYINTLANNGVAEFQLVPGVADDTGSNWSVIMTDYDGDNDLDILSINDFVDTKAYRNDGVDVNGLPLFVDDDPSVGLGLTNNGMGIAVADYDRSGTLDYFITGIGSDGGDHGNLLLSNNGDNTFSNIASESGVSGDLTVFYWGTAAADIDNDGDPDIYAGNNMQRGFSPNSLYVNNGENIFSNVAIGSGADQDSGRTVASADYDNDGRIDFVVSGARLEDYNDANSPKINATSLIRNTTTVDNRHWLEIKLVGQQSNKRGIGAKIKVTSTTAGWTITQLQEVNTGTSHRSSNAFPRHFGFPSGSSIDEVKIEWPSGQTQTIDSVALDQSLMVVEGINPPVITGMFPSSGSVGTFVYLNGSGFCHEQCSSTSSTETSITIGGVTIAPNWVQDNFLWFYVPAGATTDVVMVNTSGGAVSSSTVFTLL